MRPSRYKEVEFELKHSRLNQPKQSLQLLAGLKNLLPKDAFRPHARTTRRSVHLFKRAQRHVQAVRLA
jgi:hypothetical protein